MITRDIYNTIPKNITKVDGWNNKNKKKDIKTVQVEYCVPTYNNQSQIDPFILKSQMFTKLSDLLVENLIDEKLINFKKFEEHYIAEIKVVNGNFSSVLIDERAFFINNKEYTEEQIKESIKNTFPEDFI